MYCIGKTPETLSGSDDFPCEVQKLEKFLRINIRQFFYLLSDFLQFTDL